MNSKSESRKWLLDLAKEEYECFISKSDHIFLMYLLFRVTSYEY